MRSLVLAPLCMALMAPAHAGPLTFDDALNRAATDAPSLRARALEVEARRSAALSAGQLPDPKLGVSLDNFPISGPPAFSLARDDMTMARLALSREVPNGAKRRAAVGRAQAEIGTAEADRQAEARRVRVAAAVAWLDLAYADRRLASVDNGLARLRRLAPSNASSVASGGARPAQSIGLDQALARLEDQRSELAAEAGKARAALSRWTGESEPVARGAVPEMAIVPAQLRAGIDRHPDLLVAGARFRAAEADVSAARAEKHPDWGFDVAYQRRDNSYGDMISAGVTVSLPFFSRRRQNPMIAAAISSEGAALAQREDARRALLADLDSAIADHVVHHDQWMRARDTLLPLARKRAELEMASYSAGRAALVEVIEADAMLIDTELQTLEREAMVARDAARLVLTYGDDR